MGAIADPLFARLTRGVRWPNRITLVTFVLAQVAAVALASMITTGRRPVTLAGMRLYGMLRGNGVLLLVTLFVSATPGFIAAQITAGGVTLDHSPEPGTL